jgi:signal transduction histidine kinase
LNNCVDSLVESDTLKVQLDEINLNDCLNSALRSLSSLIHSSRTTISINFTELEIIKFNRAYLGRIFLNLITNAIKYAIPGMPPDISVHSAKVDGYDQLTFQIRESNLTWRR